MQESNRIRLTAKTAVILTNRELEILGQISLGLSSKEIAQKMFISTHTVNNHRKNMLIRSKCGNVAELVRIAIFENLL